LVVLAAVLLVLAIPMVSWAATEIDWATSEPVSGTVEGSELFVEADSGDLYPLIVIEDPGVQPPRFEVDGTVRHEDVAGVAYFEMWTVLPDGSRYFTRTLAETGPLGIMTGDSDTRPFSLPFELGEGGPVPTQLEINLVTEGAGRFWVGPLVIAGSAVEPTSTTSPTTATSTASTVDAEVPPTTVAAEPDESDSSGLWWGLAGVVAVVALGAVLWTRSVRRRRAEEQRRMDAMDSLRS
jgi:hypothetical protein